MSMTLILWKAPQVREPEDAEALLKPFYDSGDESAFEQSPAIAAFARSLKRLYPWRMLSNAETVARMPEEERLRYKPEALKEIRGVEGGEQFATLPWFASDRLMLIDIVWSASDQLLDDIVRLSREHGLVLYDPQGPTVNLSDDPLDSEPAPPPTWRDWIRLVAMVVVLSGLTIAAWFIPIAWIRWPAMIIIGFVAAAAWFVLWLMIFGPEEDDAGQSSKS